MDRRAFAASLFTGIASATASAGQVGVPGSKIRFEDRVERDLHNGKVALRLTGTALREQAWFNVYAIASYLAEKTVVRSPAELASVDAPKCLHLILERDVAGADMATNVAAMIVTNHPTAFPTEVRQLNAYMTSNSVRRGDQVWITHQPGRSVVCAISGKPSVEIANPAFSRAIWDIYLGPRNLGPGLKAGLVSRL